LHSPSEYLNFDEVGKFTIGTKLFIYK